MRKKGKQKRNKIRKARRPQKLRRILCVCSADIGAELRRKAGRTLNERLTAGVRHVILDTDFQKLHVFLSQKPYLIIAACEVEDFEGLARLRQLLAAKPKYRPELLIVDGDVLAGDKPETFRQPRKANPREENAVLRDIGIRRLGQPRFNA